MQFQPISETRQGSATTRTPTSPVTLHLATLSFQWHSAVLQLGTCKFTGHDNVAARDGKRRKSHCGMELPLRHCVRALMAGWVRGMCAHVGVCWFSLPRCGFSL